MTPGSSYTTARAGKRYSQADLLVPVCWLIRQMFKLLSQPNLRLTEQPLSRWTLGWQTKLQCAFEA